MNVGEGATGCFWLEPTGLYRIGLRRFTFNVDAQGPRPGHRDCPSGSNGCDASVVTERELPVVYEVREGHDMRTLAGVPDEHVPGHRSRLWPRNCEACGEKFPSDAQWQAFTALGYVRSDTNETVWIRHVHGREWAGALYDAPWLRFVGPDGIALVAVCPNGLPWPVDGEATGGGHWTRTGDPRQPETLTVQPSIVAGDYHGFLQAGQFTAHIG